MIVVDLCNTVADVNNQLVHFFDQSIEKYPAPIPKEFFTSPEGLTLFMKANPIIETLEYVQKFAMIHTVIYVTCRPRESRFVTQRWLATNEMPQGEIFFCKNAEEKIKIAKDYRIHFAFEDDPETIMMYNESGIPVFCPEWPYNKGLEVPDMGNLIKFKRCFSGGVSMSKLYQDKVKVYLTQSGNLASFKWKQQPYRVLDYKEIEIPFKDRKWYTDMGLDWTLKRYRCYTSRGMVCDMVKERGEWVLERVWD